MNLMDLFVRIGVDDQASDKVGGIAASLGKGLQTAAKVGVAAVSAASTAIAGLATASIKHFADYEQLVGGVETLFKDSASIVSSFADDAFKTAGLSANEYMETVTSFSASLLQGLEGDTTKAAFVANRAITDMSDNANKMGTSMDMIQNAYQGFAKQNYTMLDNLKLGYGGTAAEMARLINDSGVLGDSITVTAKTVNSVSFDKIIEAIGVIQDEMGITGTTAKEAASTISGSAKAMKSAWTNLLAGLAGGSANLDDLIGNFVDSVKTLGGNVMPVLERVLGGAVDLVNGLAPVIAGALPSLVSQVAPDLIKGGISILEALIRGISENVGMLADSAAEVIVSLVTGLIGLLPELLVAGQQILLALADALVEALPELIPAITETVTEIVRLLTEPDTLGLLLEASIAIIMALAEGLIKALPDLIKALPEIINNMVEFLVSQAPQIVLAGVELLMALVNGIVSALPALTDAAINLVTQVYNTLSSSVGKLVDIGSQIVQSIKNGISSAWSGLVSWFEGLWDSLFGNRDVDVNVNTNGYSGTGGSYAGGLSYVPYDNFVANLHKGERVLTNEEAREYNAGRTGGGITIVQNISATPTTPIELAAATQAYFQQARWAF